MGRKDYRDQYKRICCWCGLVSYLGIGMSYDEFHSEFVKAKNKTKFKNEFEKQCQSSVWNYICEVGYEVFAEEVKKYHKTLPPGVKKRRPETYARWAGLVSDSSTREKALKNEYTQYRTSCSDSYYDVTGDLGLSYDSWLKYCK